jgi:transposase-like protein
LSTDDRKRAVQLVLDSRLDRGSGWLTINQIASNFGTTPQALHTWVRKAERARG